MHLFKLLPISFIFLIVTFSATHPEDIESVTRHILPSWGNDAPQVIVEMPSYFSLESSKKSDFDVHCFSTKSEYPRIGIYIGHHPNLFSDDKEVKKVRGNVGGRKVEWLRWEESDVFNSECIVSNFFPENDSYGPLMLHIFIASKSEEQLAQYESAFITLCFNNN